MMEFNEFEKDLLDQVSLSVEKDRSGKAIDWSYWTKHKAIKPKEAALLAYHVCPNMVCSALRIEENHLYPYQEIKELKSLLASHEKQWTLAELLRFLREYGYFVPFGMEQAVFNGKLELVDGVAIESPALINHPETESKYKYDAYKLSLDALASNVDIKVLTVEAIYDQLAILDKKLWNISLTTFRRDVWQKYSGDCGIKKQAGRPRRK